MNARFRGRCLEPELVTAFTDGELDHARRDAVHQHLVACRRCRADVEGERRAKRAVQSLAELQPAPELVARLTALAGAPDIAGPVPADLVAARAARAARHDDGAAGPDRRARRNPGALLAAAASVAVFVVGGTAYLGASSPAAPEPAPAAVTVVPAADRYAVEHAASSVDNGFDESALTTVSTSWFAPSRTAAP